jgi:NADH-quinone oxidoreductase subunit L
MPDLPLMCLSFAVLLLPLLSFFLCHTIGEKFSWLISLISTAMHLLATLASLLLYLEVYGNPESVISWPWITLGGQHFEFGFIFNDQVVVMTFMVTLVSALVHFYSIGYMADDRASKKYFAFLGFFTFAMLGLILSSNLLVTFCFWELVGFSSYRLISYYREQNKAASAATKAFLMNRVGDMGFLIGLLLLWSSTGTLDIIHVTQSHFPLQTAAGLCIFLGIVGKSAQFPLFTWLPDAMRAPTPVSALIHAATMVAAGVYLLVRLHPLFTTEAFVVITVVGTATALLGAVAALFQYDLKKILAYSTMSQLGLMVMAMGAAPQASFLHLLNHAFFKAGLFLGAGAIIHAMHLAHHTEKDVDVQDIRNMGALRTQMPVTFFCFAICSAALAGLPLTSGFISKDILLSQLGSTAGSLWSLEGVALLVAWITVFLTPVYTFRVCWYVFFGKMKNDLVVLHEAPMVMRIPMIMLAIISLTVAVSFAPFSITAWTSKLMYVQQFEESPYVPYAATGIVMAALILAFYLYRHQPTRSSFRFLTHNFLLDSFYAKFIVRPYQVVAGLTLSLDKMWIDKSIHRITYLQVSLAHLTAWFDRTVVDGSVNLMAGATGRLGTVTRYLAAGKIQTYILWAMLGLIIFMIWFLIL